MHSSIHSFIHSLIPSLFIHSFIHVSNTLMFPQVDMYAGAIFIQQSLHLDLYLATTGLLAITALYTITGMTEEGDAWRGGRGWGPLQVFLAHLLVSQGVRTTRSFSLYPLPRRIRFPWAVVLWKREDLQMHPNCIKHLLSQDLLPENLPSAGV